MKYTLIIKEEAAAEIRDAYVWYEEQKSGLGAEFMTILEEYFARIVSNPLLYQAGEDEERVAVVNRFPYKIVYISRKD